MLRRVVSSLVDSGAPLIRLGIDGGCWLSGLNSFVWCGLPTLFFRFVREVGQSEWSACRSRPPNSLFVLPLPGQIYFPPPSATSNGPPPACSRPVASGTYAGGE